MCAFLAFNRFGMKNALIAKGIISGASPKNAHPHCPFVAAEIWPV